MVLAKTIPENISLALETGKKDFWVLKGAGVGKYVGRILTSALASFKVGRGARLS